MSAEEWPRSPWYLVTPLVILVAFAGLVVGYKTSSRDREEGCHREARKVAEMAVQGMRPVPEILGCSIARFPGEQYWVCKYGAGHLDYLVLNQYECDF